MAVRTDGCQSRTSVRRVAGDDNGACGTLGQPGGGWSTVVDSDPCERRWRCGERQLTMSLAGNSSCNRVLRDEGTMVDPILHLDGDGGGWWWRSMVSRAACSGERSRGEGGHSLA
jgi:hypothetical protein